MQIFMAAMDTVQSDNYFSGGYFSGSGRRTWACDWRKQERGGQHKL